MRTVALYAYKCTFSEEKRASKIKDWEIVGDKLLSEVLLKKKEESLKMLQDKAKNTERWYGSELFAL